MLWYRELRGVKTENYIWVVLHSILINSTAINNYQCDTLNGNKVSYQQNDCHKFPCQNFGMSLVAVSEAYRSGLNRWVAIGRYNQIMGCNLRQGLNCVKLIGWWGVLLYWNPDLWTVFRNIEKLIYLIIQREYGRDNGRELSSLYKWGGNFPVSAWLTFLRRV